jgi:hypothetical protein
MSIEYGAMNHLTEEDLILHYYDEVGDAVAVDRHLDTCPECRAAYASLERVLNVMDAMPVPERNVAYEAAVWRRLRAASLRPALWKRTNVRWPGLVLALASLVVAIVLIRRPPLQTSPGRDRQTAGVQEQILRLAVGDYLERSGIVLTELANASPAGPLDIALEQERAADLLAECRLYHQTALRARDSVVAGGLDELERVLLEIAHAPSRLDPAQVDELRQRLRSQGVLFRIRILRSAVKSEDEHKL